MPDAQPDGPNSDRSTTLVERRALLPIAVESLRPLSTGLVVVYTSIIPVLLLELSGIGRVLTVVTASALAVFYLLLRLFLDRATLSASRLRLLSAAIVGLPYLSILLLFYFDPAPLYTGFVLIVLIGCGSFFLSARWIAGSILTISTTWAAVAIYYAPSIDPVRLIGVLLVGAAVGIAVYVSRRRDLDSTNRALASAARELARREAAERSLRDSERRLELAIQGSRGGWWFAQVDRPDEAEIPERIYLSPALKQLIGFQPDEFPDSLAAWRERILPEDRAKVEESAREHLAGVRKEHRVEYRIRHKSGEILWMETLGRLERDESGRPIQFSGLDRDITERIDRQRALDVLSRAVEQSSSIVLITDPEGRITYVNPKFTRVTGYTAEEVLGRNPRILKSQDTPPETYDSLWKTITSGGEWHGEIKNISKSGEPYWVLASISPLTDDTGQVISYLGVEEDITERKAAELRQMKSQRLEAVGQLVAGIAHDFNNLLTSMLGFSELVLSELPPESESCQSHLEQIITAGESAAALTRQLLAIGRQQVLRPRLLDLNAEVRKHGEFLRRTLGEDIEFSMSLDPGIAPVKVDSAQLQQILLNLAVNARDAMPLGGILTFETANAELDEEYARRHPGAEAGSYVMLAVSDNGCGMDSETLRRVFEPFFTTKKRGKGSGLGLATTYGIIKQSGGYIWAYSEPGRGTTFKIYLPREMGSVEEKASEAPKSRRGGHETILLVEDAENVRELLSNYLSGAGYKVLEASDAAQAQRLAAERDGQIDLLITDLVLPQDNGIRLAELLGSRLGSIKTLLITGYAESVLRRKHALSPSIPLLSKPFTMHDLAKTVRRILDHDDVKGSAESKSLEQ